MDDNPLSHHRRLSTASGSDIHNLAVALRINRRGDETVRIIGLTGGIASGKSTVARIMESLGGVIIDADQLARETVLPGEPAYLAIVAEFGEGILKADRTLDRQALGKIIFVDKAARLRLEEITHPAIAHEGRCKAKEVTIVLQTKSADGRTDGFAGPKLPGDGLGEELRILRAVGVHAGALRHH